MLFNFNSNFGLCCHFALIQTLVAVSLKMLMLWQKNVNNASTDTRIMPTTCEKKVLSVRNRRQK